MEALYKLRHRPRAQSEQVLLGLNGKLETMRQRRLAEEAVEPDGDSES